MHGESIKIWNEINMIMPIEEWCLTPGTPISLQWDYYTCDRFEKIDTIWKSVSLKASKL